MKGERTCFELCARSKNFKMLKLFGLATTIFAVLIPVSSKMALSRPLPSNSQPSVEERSEPRKPVCYMQTADGRTLDLSSTCRKNPASSTPKPGNPTNQSCRTKDECLTIFGPNNPPPPVYLPPGNSPLG
jgi:hypothetical protein